MEPKFLADLKPSALVWLMMLLEFSLSKALLGVPIEVLFTDM